MSKVDDIQDSAAQVLLPSIIDKLREAVRPPGKRSIWLDNLSDLDLVKVFIMLKEGRKSTKIIEAIESWGYAVLEHRSMTELLVKFKARTLGEISLIFEQGKKLTTQEKQIATRAKDRLSHVQGKIDDVWVLNTLITEQLERYQFWKSLDTNADVEIAKQVDRIVDSIRNLVKDRFEILVKLGAVAVKPHEAKLEVSHIHRLALKHIEDVQSVVELTDEFSQELESLAIPLIEQNDGSFQAEYPSEPDDDDLSPFIDE
jgi:hypothetical protein